MPPKNIPPPSQYPTVRDDGPAVVLTVSVPPTQYHRIVALRKAKGALNDAEVVRIAIMTFLDKSGF